jgi:hypothetical protein
MTTTMMMATTAAARATVGQCADKWDGDDASTTMIPSTTD